MKRILIFGDSWAVVPNDMGKNDQYINDRNNWMDFQLMRRGHHVYNIGRCAESNRNAIGYAQQIIDGFFIHGLDLDLIIWYHTESLRDLSNQYNLGNPEKDSRAREELNKIKQQGLDAYVDDLADIAYNTVTSIKTRYPDTKWVIVGGHGPIRKSKKHLLEWADILIENWRYDITGIDCPDCQCYTLIRYHGFEWYIDSLTREVVEREMSYANTITEACRSRDNFYDGVHPAGPPNRHLTRLIIERFNL